MSRIVTHSESWSGYPTSYLSDHQYYQASSQNNALTSTTSTNYANINLTRGSSAETYWYVAFNTNAIPQNATITSCSAKYRCAISNTNSNYVKTRQLRFYSGTNPKGNTATLTTSSSVTSINIGEWTREELNDARVRYYAQRNSGNTNNSIYIRPYGTDLTVNYSWDETFYEFTCNSSVDGVGMTSGETTSGGSYTATITGISDISAVVIKDNGTDVTNTFTKSGNNYVKTYSNVDSDHSITIEASAIPTIPSFVKKNTQYKQVSKAYKKNGNAWEEKSILSVMWKINNTWTSTTSSMSGKTAFTTEQ